MSGLLMGSAIVTTLLIPAEAFGEGGEASGRALAYLAHEGLGELPTRGLPAHMRRLRR